MPSYYAHMATKPLHSNRKEGCYVGCTRTLLPKSPAQIAAANALKMASNALSIATPNCQLIMTAVTSVLAERTQIGHIPSLMESSTRISHRFFFFWEAACIVISVLYSST